MSLTILPTVTEGSLGPLKADRVPVPNLVEYVSAQEVNNAKTALAAVCAAVGLGDGSSSASIERVVRQFLSTPGEGGRSVLFAPCWGVPQGDPLAAAVAGTGTVTGVDWPTLSAAGITKASGWLSLAAPAGSDSAAIQTTAAHFDPVLEGLEFEARIYTADEGDGIVRAGFIETPFGGSATGDRVYAQNASGVWELSALSSAGGGNASTSGGSVAVAGEQVIRIVRTSTRWELYVDDVLAAETSGLAASAIPQAGDQLGAYVYAQRTAASGPTVYVDFVRVAHGAG
jgi:hypothetical protein